MISLTSQTSSSQALEKVDSAIEKVLSSRANIAANQSRLRHIVEQATRFSIEVDASLSKVNDTNYEIEQTNLSKARLLAQSASALLKKAQVESEGVLSYIEGNRIRTS